MENLSTNRLQEALPGDFTVSLLILTSGTDERLPSLSHLLHSIAEQTTKSFDVIVASEKVGEGLRKTLENNLTRIPHMLISTGLWNKCRTANLAIRSCQSEFIFLLEDDLVLERNFVESLLGTFNLGEDVGCAYSKCIWMTPEGWSHQEGMVGKLAKYLSRLRIHDSLRIGKTLGENLSEVSVFTMSVACRRKALFDAGLYDEHVDEPILGEDYDLALRVRKAGYRIVLNANTASYHYTRQVTKTIGKLVLDPSYIRGRNLSEVYFVAKNRDVFGFAVYPHYVYRLLESVAWGIRSRRPLALLLGFVGASQGLVKGLAAQRRQTHADPPLGDSSV